MSETHECSWLCMSDGNAHYLPASETPGPGEGDLRGEAPVFTDLAVANAWIEQTYADFIDANRVEVALDDAVEQRTLAEQKVARVRDALAAAFSGDDYQDNAEAAAGEGEWSWFRWLAISTLDAALADPEADR